MVLESLVTPFKAEKHPIEMFFIGMVYSSVAVLISTQIFEDMAGIIAVFLTVMASIPLMYSTMKFEEEKDLAESGEIRLLKEHAKAISFLTFLFLGIMVSFTLWYTFLPPATAENLFSLQINTIKSINGGATAMVSVSPGALFSKILFNNIRVLLFCMLFALFYGAGSIFILTWNASVIAVAIGTLIRNHIAEYANLVGVPFVAGYMHVFSLSLARYMIHGIPEIIAYFVGGLAGGIISIAIIKRDFSSERFEKILIDTADLVVISLLILVIGALIEVFITPVLFMN
ncbi:MAG: stage II sporulation protein M [Candidatus Woesearchaeota archaeon]|nr:stage II sporulation protein M [Candidatus Woesearchaeota archaeon]